MYLLINAKLQIKKCKENEITKAEKQTSQMVSVTGH